MFINNIIKTISQLKVRIKNKITIFWCYLYARRNQNLFIGKKIIFGLNINQVKNFKYHYSSLKDRDNILNTPSEQVSGDWGGVTPSFYNYDPIVIESVQSKFTSVKIFQGSPLVESQTFYDVIYMPQHRCFYLKDGSRIDYSCRPEYKIAPKKITPPENLKTLNQIIIYGGHLHRHYGHFLTECICRLWYAFKDENYPILYSETPRFNFQEDFVDIFMRAINLDKKRCFYCLQPIHLKEVIIPYPSYIFGEKGFSAHKLIPEAVAQNLLPDSLEKTSQPLYLSRSKLTAHNSFRQIKQEEKLEEILREKNFAIVYPEQLTLQEQIYLINKHEVIVGICGSALHNILFSLSPNKHLVCLEDNDNIHNNFLIIDAIKSINSSYIATLIKDENSKQLYHRQDRILNLDLVTSGLKQIGLL